MRLFEAVNDTKGNAGGWTGLVASAVPFPLATIEINMDEIELLRL